MSFTLAKTNKTIIILKAGKAVVRQFLLLVEKANVNRHTLQLGWSANSLEPS